MITSISAHFMPDTKVPGELSLTKILNPVSNLYHQAPELKTATVIRLILKTPLISDVIMGSWGDSSRSDCCHPHHHS